MLYIYIGSLIFGGILLGASLILGVNTDSEFHGHSAEISTDGDSPGLEFLLLRILSVRFWTFFLAFFGLTGLTMQGLGLIGSGTITAILASIVGVVAGSSAVWILDRLNMDETNSVAQASQFVGKSARVLVALDGEKSGKIRLDNKGAELDLTALSIDGIPCEKGDEVLIVEIEGSLARVAKNKTIE